MSYFTQKRNMSSVKTYRKSIQKNTHNLATINLILDEFYQYMKDIAPDYLKQGELKGSYHNLIKELYWIEDSLPTTFIIESSSAIPKNSSKATDKLDYIVEIIRRKLLNRFPKSEYLNKVNLRGYCIYSSQETEKIANDLGLPCKVYMIHPAFYKEKNLYENGHCHCFALVRVSGKEYIVDVTYSQFFLLGGNNLNRIGIPLLGGSYAGSFMVLTEERKRFASTLIRDGYIEATDENIKLYFDGFALSYRNGLYYEEAGNIIYETEYTSTDYKNFINGLDSQVNHEKIEHLGRQYGVLKNAKLEFKPQKTQ